MNNFWFAVWAVVVILLIAALTTIEAVNYLDRKEFLAGREDRCRSWGGEPFLADKEFRGEENYSRNEVPIVCVLPLRDEPEEKIRQDCESGQGIFLGLTRRVGLCQQ